MTPQELEAEALILSSLVELTNDPKELARLLRVYALDTRFVMSLYAASKILSYALRNASREKRRVALEAVKHLLESFVNDMLEEYERVERLVGKSLEKMRTLLDSVQRGTAHHQEGREDKRYTANMHT